MRRFEYKVVPAPRRGEKARGVKSAEDRFALALSMVMNELGAEGWDYVRADALPCDERAGLTGTKTTYQNMLVFRREIAPEAGHVPVFTRAAAGAAALPAAGEPPAQTRIETETGSGSLLLGPTVAAPGAAAPGVQVPVGTALPAAAGPAPALGPARADVAAE